jgi:hypothetical protein
MVKEGAFWVCCVIDVADEARVRVGLIERKAVVAIGTPMKASNWIILT